jgi:preprotein translocase subunit SecA
VVSVPTHRPVRRRELPCCVLGTADAKWQAIVEEVRSMRAINRAVLIGSRSIDKSQALSAVLSQAGLEHEVLNARQFAREAEIVARAGEPGRITVATNMAGRGTDIRLSPEVMAAGGLHVIASELHESARIDRQLFGRCARQGDPGSYRQYLALDDEILLGGLGEKRALALARRGRDRAGPFESLASWFYRAQRNVERRHSRQRFALLRQERERQRSHRELGQDPLLDWPE